MRIMIAVIAVMVVSVLSIAAMSPSDNGAQAAGDQLQARVPATSQN
ncbi:hypothetical protein [Rhizobium sp. Root1203]|nr:hypothetical protein [Rhizobium sp. Root1203]